MSQAADALMGVFGFKRVKPKRCKVCKEEFIPSRMGQKVCGPDCASQMAKKMREKVERAEDRRKKEALKTRSQWMKEAQIAFNAFIRERDKEKACICCGFPLHDEKDSAGGAFDCGHYRSVGSAPNLRFDERNAHGQRKQCNRYGAGRAVDYRRGLITRMGLEVVEAIEADQTPRHYTIDDLKAIKAEYVQKLKELREKEAA